ncbi:MAG: DUF362 domain-containing protein [Desulfobacterota bacterium]|nr:DUF362 domain-containing protein [Thermodesulfobacteriota bacterium]
MNITRREFLKNTAVLSALIGGVPLAKPLHTLAQRAAPPTTVAMVTGDRPAAVRAAIMLLGGIERFVPRGSRVVLKPNMSFPHPPDRATNTHPEVVATVARLCRDAGAAEVLVLDYPFNPPERCVTLSGIADACRGIKNVYVHAIAQQKFFKPHPLPRGKAVREVLLMRDVLESDILISLPTAKSHTTTGVSLGMKGLMGLIWDRRYFHAQVDINQAIADLVSGVNVHLTVLDGSRALVTGGPSGPGTVVFPNTIIAGTDPVAVDALGVSLAPWYNQQCNASQIHHIVAASRMGLGTMRTDEISLLKKQV